MKSKFSFVLFWPVLLLFAGQALAAPTVACHCFRDRDFDPARPDAVDPYLLANAQNSLLAAVFDLSKKTIVREKMGGADNDQLWISNAFSEATGMPPDQAIAERDKVGSWAELFARMEKEGKVPQGKGSVFRPSKDDTALAAAIVDEALRKKLGITAAAVTELRALGNDNREVILASVLGRIGGVPPVDLVYGVRKGTFTWGETAQRFGVIPSQMEERVRQLVNSTPSG